jgi:hypothetical protein
MTNDDRDKLNQIHTTVCGVDGRGGLIDDVHVLKKDVSHLKQFRYWLLGAAAAAGAVISAMGTHVKIWLSKVL